jgi:hypothetical protein
MTRLFIFYFNSCNQNNHNQQQLAILEFTDLSFEIYFNKVFDESVVYL